MSFIGVYTAVYAYVPQAEGELAIEEGDILYLLQKSDIDEWWTVKKRVLGNDVEEPVGLVPSNYIETAPVTGSAVALYDYDRQTEEELSFKEADLFEVYEDSDPDWILVKKSNSEAYGFVPSNYIELRKGATDSVATAPSAAVLLPPPSHPSLATSTVNATSDTTDETPSLPSVPRPTYTPSNELVQDREEEELPPPKPIRPTASISSSSGARESTAYSNEEHEQTSRSERGSSRRRHQQHEDDEDEGELYTWQVSEVDGRKKIKAMLAIGNSTIYFSPDASSSKPQQWKVKDLLSFSAEKKHIFFEFKNPLYSLEIHAGSKDVAAQILGIVGELKGSVSSSGLKEVQQAASAGKAASPSTSGKKKAKILYDFEANGSDELTVFEGDTVFVINDKKSKDWWLVQHADTNKSGVVPAQFVQVLGESKSSSFSSKFKLNRSKSKENVSERAPSSSRPDEPPRLSQPKASRVRTWEDRTGSFKVDAEFLGVVEGKIHLHKTNGVKIAVAAPKLSLVDLEYVERVTGMSLDAYKSSKSTTAKKPIEDDRERRERRERERKRRERDQREREEDQREKELDERERQKERARWDKAREKEYQEREREREERERDRRERELERQEREKLRQELDEAKQAVSKVATMSPPAEPARPTSAASNGKKKEQYDWFEFFLEAGVDVNQCQRYSTNFNKEDIDPNILESIDSSVLRTLGLKEGDIIRVNRHIDNKFNRQPKDAANGSGGLFTEPSGALKVNRTGSASQVGASLPKSSDDDAWTVKPAANSEPSSNNTLVPPTTTASLGQQFTGSMQDLVNLKPLQPTATASSVKSQTYAPTPSKPLEPVKPNTSVTTPQKTGNQLGSQATGTVALDPFKTGGGNILPLATGGFVYLPIQQTGLIGMQPTGLIPLQKTGQLGLQPTGLIPLQKTGQASVMPVMPSFGMPLQRTGGYQAPVLTGGLMPTTTFGQTVPLQRTGGLPPVMMKPTLTGGLPPLMNPTLTGGLPQQQPLGTGFNTSILPQASFNQPLNGGVVATSFSSQPTGFTQHSTFGGPQATGFNAFSQQQPNFNQQAPGFQPQLTQPFGFNPQLNQMQNQFQNTSISSPPTFNNVQPQLQPTFGQPQFGGVNQFGQQPQPQFGQQPQVSFGQQQQPQTSFGFNAPQQALEAQPTGFGFGNTPQAQSQQRANLANASAENPFGF